MINFAFTNYFSENLYSFLMLLKIIGILVDVVSEKILQDLALTSPIGISFGKVF